MVRALRTISDFRKKYKPSVEMYNSNLAFSQTFVKSNGRNNSRRKFIQQSALLGAGIILRGSTGLFAENKNFKKRKMTKTNSDTAKQVSFQSNNTNRIVRLNVYTKSNSDTIS